MSKFYLPFLCVAALLCNSARAQESTNTKQVKIKSQDAIIHIGSLDSFDITPAGIEAARLVLGAAEKLDKAAAKRAIALYNKLIPHENFGGEYTALQWFAEYMIASQDEQKKMRQDPLVDAYYHFFADDDYKVLKEYIRRKYKFTKREIEDPEIGHTRRAFLEDFILFNNPKREKWEETSKFMKLLPIKEGDKVIDIGCGPGYYTYLFSKLVGDNGKVYALDIKPEHLDFLTTFIQTNNLKNIETIVSKTNDVVVRPDADIAFMCSLYHIIYAVSPEGERNEFVESIKASLKPGGKLVIVDNGPVEDTELPYHGPNIAHELITAQMEHHGFKLEQFEQVIPQRYLLVFSR